MQELEQMDMGELCDMLVRKTTDLLKMMEQRSKGDQLQQLKKEVEGIQEAIKRRGQDHS